MDCTLIRCSALEKMQKPWFKTVDIDQHIDGVAAAESWTEDLFFFDRLTKSGGRAFIDASIICEHWDVYTRKAWKLPSDSLPMRVKGVVKDKKCLMLGPLIPLADETYDFVRCTAEADSSADYRLAYDNLPFETAEFDFVVVSEPLLGIDHYLPEWKRVSRPGAKIAINLHPDLHKGRLAKRLKGHIDGSFLEIHNE